MKTRVNMCLVVLILSLQGCAWTDKSGTRHVLILGIGLVSTAGKSSVEVQNHTVLGMAIGNGGICAGLFQKQAVEIDPRKAENVIISIGATPLSLAVTNYNPNFSTNQQANTTSERN